MTYTAQELSDILSQTRIDSISNKPLLMPDVDRAITEKAQSDDAPELGKFIHQIGGSSAIVSMLNYWTIKDQIHAYQTQHHVSGIIDQTFECLGQSITYPYWDDQLILQDWDVPILTASVPRVLEFFLDLVGDRNLFFECDDEELIAIDEDAIRNHARSTTYIWLWDESMQWTQVAPDQWQGGYVDKDDPDKIGSYLYLDRPDNDEGEVLRIVAEHKDLARFPWRKSA